MKNKILITGAGGYMGGHITRILLDAGVDVTAVDMYTDKIDKRANIIQEDIFSGDKDIYKKLGAPDVCLHLAWRDGFNHNSDAHMACLSEHYIFVDNMINGGLGQLAVMGSMHEVGYYEGAINEDTLCNPSSFYGIAKDALRRSLLIMAKNKKITLQWIRGYYIYGDDEGSNSIFGKLIKAARAGEKTFPFTSGKNKYDFIHVEQLARQISAVVMQNEVDGIINCCSGEAISLADKVEAFIQENNLEIQLEYGAFPDRIYDSPAVWGDNMKISSILRSSVFAD